MKIVVKRFVEHRIVELYFDAVLKHLIIIGYWLVYLLYGLNNSIFQVFNKLNKL